MKRVYVRRALVIFSLGILMLIGLVSGIVLHRGQQLSRHEPPSLVELEERLERLEELAIEDLDVQIGDTETVKIDVEDVITKVPNVEADLPTRLNRTLSRIELVEHSTSYSDESFSLKFRKGLWLQVGFISESVLTTLNFRPEITLYLTETIGQHLVAVGKFE